VHAVPELTARGWGLVIYILLMPTIVAYALNAWALGRSNPTLVTVYIYLQPLIAAALSYVQLGIVPTGTMGASSVLILAGVAVVALRR
jgi:drug/metabolite transporter (DMT)-like permease